MFPPGMKKGHLGRAMAPVDAEVEEWILRRLEMGSTQEVFADRNQDMDTLQARVAELESQ